jgi:SseB protein N-terminal domain
MPDDVLVNAPGPSVITDDMRAAALQAPGGWLFAVDPALDPAGEVPDVGLIGAWRVGEDGQIGEDFRVNPEYRPSPAARGWPPPVDELDRTAQLAAAGYATLDDVAVALLHQEVSYAADRDGAAILDEHGRLVVYSRPPEDPAGASWSTSSGRELAPVAASSSEVVVNPGPWEAEVSAADLTVRAAAEASGEQLVAQIEEFLAGELDGPALHEAFCSSYVFCQAGDKPGFLAVDDGEGGERVVPVFTSLVALARRAGQTAWFSTIGQEALDLLPDGYDVVVDPGSPHTVRLRGSATELQPRLPRRPDR